MAPRIPGIHHVTAIGGDPQANADFWVALLGLRLVKRTVNFDDPNTHHLYYGDEEGHPGTILTFFPWPGAPRGRRGTGQTTATAFSVPADSLDWWAKRLEARGVAVSPVSPRFDERVLSFEDPDGLAIELVEDDGAAGGGFWSKGPVPAEHAIRGFHSVTLTEDACARTDGLLTEVMGFERAGEEGNRHRYTTGRDAQGARLDVLDAPGERRGHVAAGTVHHVAFRCASDAEQETWRRRVETAGIQVTPALDRQYFRSIYFREPGGVLFEIATDPPGFTIDESIESLGTRLQLPPWLEERRAEITGGLPRLDAPDL